MSLIACKCGCGQKIESSAAYKMTINGCTFRFLSETHYLRWSSKAKAKRGEFDDPNFIRVYNLISDIVGYEEGTKGAIKRKYEEWLKTISLENIIGYLSENKDKMINLIKNNDIHEFLHALAYINKVVLNEAPKYKKEEIMKAGKDLQVVKENQAAYKKRKSLAELEEEL